MSKVLPRPYQYALNQLIGQAEKSGRPVRIYAENAMIVPCRSNPSVLTSKGVVNFIPTENGELSLNLAQNGRFRRLFPASLIKEAKKVIFDLYKNKANLQVRYGSLLADKFNKNNKRTILYSDLIQ